LRTTGYFGAPRLRADFHDKNLLPKTGGNNRRKDFTVATGPKKEKISRTWNPDMHWAVTGNHVYPIDDLRDHVPNDCWCKPHDDEGVIVHHSLDSRELYENGERKTS
jgi:hypothetical protein